MKYPLAILLVLYAGNAWAQQSATNIDDIIAGKLLPTSYSDTWIKHFCESSRAGLTGKVPDDIPMTLNEVDKMSPDSAPYPIFAGDGFIIVKMPDRVVNFDCKDMSWQETRMPPVETDNAKSDRDVPHRLNLTVIDKEQSMNCEIVSQYGDRVILDHCKGRN